MCCRANQLFDARHRHVKHYRLRLGRFFQRRKLLLCQACGDGCVLFKMIERFETDRCHLVQALRERRKVGCQL